jgi:hypothetical protein
MVLLLSRYTHIMLKQAKLESWLDQLMIAHVGGVILRETATTVLLKTCQPAILQDMGGEKILPLNLLQ